MDGNGTGLADEELMATELAVFILADMVHSVAAGMPARRSLPDLAEDTLSAYPDAVREIVLAGLAATDPASLDGAPQPPETRRRGHLRLVSPG
jgi:hypothetical protein